MDKRVKRIVSEIDVVDFYREAFPDWDGKSNLPCPFPDKHGKGEDSHPSFKIFLDTGGSYCHGCGYKCTSPVSFWIDYKEVSFNKALRTLWSRYIEKLVPPEAYRSPMEKLQQNPLVLNRLEKLRGISKDTARRFRLGYDGKRLTIPVFNKEGWCVNVRRYDLFKDGGPKMVSWKEGYGQARLFPLESLRANQVFVVEGELDAILACQYGIAAVTPAGGALTWKPDWSKLFTGKDVFIIPDNDPAGIKGAETRRKAISAFAKVCSVVSLPVKGEKEDLTDWFLRYGGTPEKLRELAGSAAKTTVAVPRGGNGLIEMEVSKTEEVLIERASMVWDKLVGEGAFFRNAMGELYYVREGQNMIPVTDKLGPFTAHFSKISPLLNQATMTGKFVYQHVKNNAYSQSALSKTGVWTTYDGNALFIHAGTDKLLKIGDGAPVHIKNAINREKILLDLPVPSMAVTVLPSTRPLEGLRHLEELFLKNLPMSDEDRYMLICWLLGAFFRDYIKPKPIVRLLAKTAYGKSTSSKLVSILLYGEELLSHSASTVAATYEMSSRYPLLLLDNIETHNMTASLIDFLLIAATGGMKAKRQVSVDRGIIMEHTNCLVLTNGIEPFVRHELIDRTMEIGLDLEKYGRPGFHEAKVFAQLKQHRGEIMGACLFLMSKYVIPRIKSGEIHRIMREFKSHGKERFNEYLALMSIILDSVWGYMPLKNYSRPHDLVNAWLANQTQATERQDEGTNDVLYFIDTLFSKQNALVGSQLKFETHGRKIVMRCTTRELLTDFRLMAKLLGMRCPWTNERQLGTRLVDAEDTLRRAGWRRKSIVRNGKRMYKYTKGD
jgi:hypothetical protein